MFDEVAAAAVGGAVAAPRLPRIAIGGAEGGTCRFEELAGVAGGLAPQAGPEALSLLLYTSGTDVGVVFLPDDDVRIRAATSPDK